jgi:hypothetical protein
MGRAGARIAVAVIHASLTGGAAAASIYTSEVKLVAPAGAAQDNFGFAVAVSGDTVVVGAYREDNAPEDNQGAAYVYRRDPVNPAAWTLVSHLTPDDGHVLGHFGFAVAIDGDTLVVGRPPVGAKLLAPGEAHVHQRDEGGPDNWGRVAILEPSDAAVPLRFGWSVAISGDTVAVGAILGDGVAADVGAAYVFQRDERGAWGEVRKVFDPLGAEGDDFGRSIALAGATLVVGAPGDDEGADLDAGSAHLFERDEGGAGNWGYVARLTASDASPFSYFGASAAIAGDGLVIGSPAHLGAGQPGQGSAYVFERNAGGPGQWGQVALLFAADGAAGDSFGRSISIWGATVVVGANLSDPPGGMEAGAAYVFNRNQGGVGAWGAIDKLTASDGAFEDELGWSVSISGSTIVAGAYLDNNANGENAGAAYVLAPPPVVFESAVAFPAIGVPSTQALGDLDADGDVDVAVVVPDPGGGPGSVQIFENLTNGGQWAGLEGMPAIGVGPDPSGVALGFLDGDRFLDLAVCHAGDGSVLVFINMANGEPEFLPAVTIPAVGVQPSDIVASDITEDGLTDLVVADAGGDALVLLVNVGLGQFTQGDPIPAGQAPLAVNPLDVDNDKCIDLAAVNFVSNDVSVLINQGAGRFGMARSEMVGAGPIDLAAGHLDGGGFVDIVTADNGAGTVSILLNNADTTFADATAEPVGASPVSVDLADVDGDLDLDIVVVAIDPEAGPSIIILQNLGAGDGGVAGGAAGFAPAAAIAVGADPKVISTGDLDGDGTADLVTVNADAALAVSVLLNCTGNTACPSDVNRDGSVDIADLVAVVLDWGCAGSPGCCTGDASFDGFTTTEDLVQVVLDWGPCGQ